MLATPLEPDRITVMIKPVGAGCNLRCGYSYYLPVAEDHPPRRMSEQTLEATLTEVLCRFGDRVTIAWQGGASRHWRGWTFSAGAWPRVLV